MRRDVEKAVLTWTPFSRWWPSLSSLTAFHPREWRTFAKNASASLFLLLVKLRMWYAMELANAKNLRRTGNAGTQQQQQQWKRKGRKACVLLSGTLLFQELVLKDLCAALRLYDAAVSSEVCLSSIHRARAISFKAGPSCVMGAFKFRIALTTPVLFCFKGSLDICRGRTWKEKEEDSFWLLVFTSFYIHT